MQKRKPDQAEGLPSEQDKGSSWEKDMTPVGKALWFIESHFSRPLSLERIADVAGLSRFHLCRAFGLATGHSVAGYLRARRLSEAAKVLAAGAPDILTVALDAGYGSHEAFTRAFREQFGQTPEALRARATLETIQLVEPIRMPDAPTKNLAEPRIEEKPPMRVAGLRDFFSYSDTAGIPALWQRFGPQIGTLPGEIAGHAYGLCLAHPDGAEGFDYLAGVALGGADRPAGLAIAEVPAQAFAVFRHDGHVSAVQATCGAIFGQWLPASGFRLAPSPVSMIEHYDKRFDPQTGMGGLEVWVPVAQ